MNPNQAVEKTERSERSMEFVPFGAADKIRLNVAIIQNTVCIPTRSGAICTERDAIRFMMLCQAQRLNPFAGDCFLTGYDGKNGPQFSLITAHCAFLKRAETSADFEGMESGIILIDDKTEIVYEREGDFKLESEHCVGGWARVFRKGRKPIYRRLSIDAMMPNYESPFWNAKKAPGQICKCAEADALRATFPTLIGGLYAEGEIKASAEAMVTNEIYARPRFLSETTPAIPQKTLQSPAEHAYKDVARAQEAEVKRVQQQATAGAPKPGNPTDPREILRKAMIEHGVQAEPFIAWALKDGCLKIDPPKDDPDRWATALLLIHGKTITRLTAEASSIAAAITTPVQVDFTALTPAQPAPNSDAATSDGSTAIGMEIHAQLDNADPLGEPTPNQIALIARCKEDGVPVAVLMDWSNTTGQTDGASDYREISDARCGMILKAWAKILPQLRATS